MNDKTKKSGFSEEHKRALAFVLDEIIPPGIDGRLPGAGEVGLAAHIEEAVVQTPGLALVSEPGLSALQELARGRGCGRLEELPKTDRAEMMAELAAKDPAFVSTVFFHACIGSYQNGRVLAALGIEPRPPHPKGYEMDAGGLELLDAVRARGKMYREC